MKPNAAFQTSAQPSAAVMARALSAANAAGSLSDAASVDTVANLSVTQLADAFSAITSVFSPGGGGV